MGSQRPTFAKQQRERDKKMRAAEKRDRRQERAAEKDTAPEAAAPAQDNEALTASILRQIDALHKQFDDEQISFEDFEERKAELFAKLPID